MTASGGPPARQLEGTTPGRDTGGHKDRLVVYRRLLLLLLLLLLLRVTSGAADVVGSRDS
jgi:hypothetical protein